MEDFTSAEYLEPLNGTELYFEHSGSQDARALFFLHGGPGYNSYSFRDLVGEDLQHFQMVYLDQRGSGRSETLTDDLNIDVLVDDVEAVRQFLEMDAFTPLGHGFGAVIALEYARRFPQYVEQVILVNPWIHMPELARVLLEKASQFSQQVFLDPKAEVLAQTPVGEFPQVGNARIERAFKLYNGQTLLNRLQFIDDRSRLRLEFSDVESQLLSGSEVQESLVAQGMWEFEYPNYLLEQKRPIKVISGWRDQTSHPHQVDWLVDLGHAQVLEMDVGHYPWLDDPEGFVAALECLMS